jgi:hypothetical protein
LRCVSIQNRASCERHGPSALDDLQHFGCMGTQDRT